MNLEKSKSIDEMNIGELEIAYIERIGARHGGVIIAFWSTIALAIMWALHIWILYWIVAAWLIFVVAGIFSIHSDVRKIQSKLNEYYGVDDD